jgi:hypothetical protein
MSLKEAMRLALERKNRQAHRIVPGTKTARQHLANSTKGNIPNSAIPLKASGRGS